MPNRVIVHRVVQIIKSVPNLSRLCSFNLGQDEIASPINEYSAASLELILLGDAYEACDKPVKADQILRKVVCVERNGQEIHLDQLTDMLFRNLVFFRYILIQQFSAFRA